MTAPVPKYFRPGQFLFNEGAPSHSMFLIKKGTVSVRKMKGPAYVEIARVYANEVIGELSFFDRQPRSAAAVALTEVEALEIEFVPFERVYDKIPDYFKTILACVADRLRKANDTIRRLQKDVIKEGELNSSGPKDEPTATDVLAATTNIAPKNQPKTADAASSDPTKPGSSPKKS